MPYVKRSNYRRPRRAFLAYVDGFATLLTLEERRVPGQLSAGVPRPQPVANASQNGLSAALNVGIAYAAGSNKPYYLDSHKPGKSLVSLPIASRLGVDYGVGTGFNLTVTGVPNGAYVGSGGAATCVIVIVTTPPDANGNTTVHVTHLNSSDAPCAVLDSWNVPDGSHFAVAGGNNESGSNSILQDVYLWKNSHKVIDDGYYDTDGLWTDGSGKPGGPNYYTMNGNGPSQNK